MRKGKEANERNGGGPRANFPIFMKLVVTLLVFSFIPFLVGSLLVLWNYDSSYQEILESPSLTNAEQESLRSRANDMRHELRVRMGFFFLLFAFFIIMGTWAATKLLVQPLAEFLSGVQKIIKGDYGARITLHSNDEFAIFAERFNQMSQQLENARRREAWISRMKSRLLTLAAHQLRTPLTAIKWILYNLEQSDYGTLSKEQANAVKKGIVSVKRMIHLITSLLEVTSIEEGRFGYHIGPVSMKQLAQESIAEQVGLAESKGVKVEFLTEDVFPETLADREKMRLVVDNLITNAIVYTPSGKKVAVSLKTEEGERGKKMLVLSVRDEGIGMTQDEQKKLFTRFFRGNEAIQMHMEGSGLGLFITKKIVEHHGGTISVESEKGKGSTFTVTIPVGKGYIPQEKGSEEFFLQE